MLRGIFPIVLIPFDEAGQIDEASLRRVVRFEIEGGVHGIGVNGFASEAYKLSEDERLRCAGIVADEVGGRLPLLIGLAPGGTEIAIEQAKRFAEFKPAALMVLPPATMNCGENALIEHYVALAEASPAPIMVQQSPHIPGFVSGTLSVEGLAQIAKRSSNIPYFKIEGTSSALRIAALRQFVGEGVGIFGGIGGIAVREEWQVGAAGLLPGVGFNEYFIQAWKAWETNDIPAARNALQTVQTLVAAVSGRGHEFSLHARKYLLQRAGIISTSYVRHPTVEVDPAELTAIARITDVLDLRIARKK